MLVSLNNVSKTYQTKTGVTYRALKNVTMQLPEKGMVFLVGASGSGKSTLLNVIGGLDNVDNGTIIVAGHSLKGMTNVEMDRFRNSLIGFVFQEFNLIETLDVFRNIKLALDMQKDGESGLKLTKEAATEKVNEVLIKMDMMDKAHVKVNALSGGQRQRVAIARALVKNPGIILADEPTGALDSGTGVAVMELFKKIAEDRLVIIVSHDLKLAEEYGDRVIELKDGSVYRDIIRADLVEDTLERDVKIVSNTLVRFSKDEQVLEADVEKINKILDERARKTFVIFETDERKVKAMFPALREAVTSNETKKPNTTQLDEEKNVALNEKKKFKQYEIRQSEMKRENLKKSNLPAGGAFKLSLNNLNHKKVRLVFTILVATIALTLFGLSGALLRFDTNVAVAATLKSPEIERVQLYAADSGKSSLIRDSVYKKIKESNPKSYFAKKYNLYDSLSENNGYMGFSGFEGFVEVDNVENIGYKVIAGVGAPKNGVVIGEFAARAILLKGVFKGATSIEDLIGKTVLGINYSYLIEGVVEQKDAQTVIRNTSQSEIVRNYYPELLYIFAPIGFVSNCLKSINNEALKASVNLLDTRKELGFQAIDEKLLVNYEVQKVGDGVMATDKDVVVSRAVLNNISIEEFKNGKIIMQKMLPIFVSEGLNVVGIVESQDSLIFVKRNIIDNALSEIWYADALITKVTGDTNKFVNSLNEAPLKINADYVQDYQMFAQIFSMLGYLIIGLACGFFLLSVLLLFSFISNSIKMTKKQIGILRAMGARRSDTFKIYALEGLIIGLVSILLAFLALIIMSPLINAALSTGYSYFLSVINLDFIIFGTMLLIGLFVSLFGVLLPIRKFVKITPIGAISNKE